MFRYVPSIVLDTGYTKASRPWLLNLRSYNQTGKLDSCYSTRGEVQWWRYAQKRYTITVKSIMNNSVIWIFLKNLSEFGFYLFDLEHLNLFIRTVRIIAASQSCKEDFWDDEVQCLVPIMHSGGFFHSFMVHLWFRCSALGCSTEHLPGDCRCLLHFFHFQKRKWGKNQWPAFPDISVQWPILVFFAAC